MAKPILLTDFQDDVISESMNGKRRYKMENNSDGTVSLEDVTEYEQVGNSYGAGQINATNQAVNESVDKNKVISDFETIGALTEEGYIPDALTVKELSSSLGRDGETGDGIMTVHEKLDFLIENGIKGDYEVAFFGSLGITDNALIYTFQKSYKKIYVIVVGSSPSYPNVTDMTLSNGVIAILDNNARPEYSVSGGTIRTTIHVRHTEAEVPVGTVLTISLNQGGWSKNQLLILGKE